MPGAGWKKNKDGKMVPPGHKSHPLYVAPEREPRFVQMVKADKDRADRDVEAEYDIPPDRRTLREWVGVQGPDQCHSCGQWAVRYLTVYSPFKGEERITRIGQSCRWCGHTVRQY